MKLLPIVDDQGHHEKQALDWGMGIRDLGTGLQNKVGAGRRSGKLIRVDWGGACCVGSGAQQRSRQRDPSLPDPLCRF